MKESGAPARGRDLFNRIYHRDLEAEAEWLRLGATAKVDSLEAVLTTVGVRPRSVLELGCGTGAVISECQRRGLGSELTAVDYSEDAIRYLAGRSQGIRCVRADITAVAPELAGTYDVVILSHVLEHLDEPLTFLRALLASPVRFRYLVAEVPLEDLWAARLKARLRDRRKNAAGHVQFFTAATFRELIANAGLTTLAERRYVPVLSTAALDLVADRATLSRGERLFKYATQRWLPRALTPIWKRFYYAHHTILASAPPKPL